MSDSGSTGLLEQPGQEIGEIGSFDAVAKGGRHEGIRQDRVLLDVGFGKAGLGAGSVSEDEDLADFSFEEAG